MIVVRSDEDVRCRHRVFQSVPENQRVRYPHVRASAKHLSGPDQRAEGYAPRTAGATRSIGGTFDNACFRCAERMARVVLKGRHANQAVSDHGNKNGHPPEDSRVTTEN